MPRDSHSTMPVALSIAGSDSGGGAGIQADLLTFAAHGVYGTTAITCLTSQNPDSVCSVMPSTPNIVTDQIQQVASYFPLKAIKTGMLFNEGIVRSVIAFLVANRHIPCIVDPVMVSTSGATLLEPEAIKCLKEELFPLASLITPNLDEARVILGWSPVTVEDMREAAKELQECYGIHVLLKGGHLSGIDLVDILATDSGTLLEIEHPRIEGVNTHGSGCTLSSSIAANVAQGQSLPGAVYSALDYVSKTMRQSLCASREHFMNHFPH